MSGMLKSMFIFSSCVSTTAAQITVWRELYLSLCVWVSCIGFVVCLFVWIFCCCDLAIWPWSDCEVEQQYHTANKRLAIAKRIAGSSKEPEELVKSKELLRSELEAVEEAQHAAKAYTLMARLFAKVIDRVSDAVAEREVQKSIRFGLSSWAQLVARHLFWPGKCSNVFFFIHLHTLSIFIIFPLEHCDMIEMCLWHVWDMSADKEGPGVAWRGLAIFVSYIFLLWAFWLCSHRNEESTTLPRPPQLGVYEPLSPDAVMPLDMTPEEMEHIQHTELAYNVMRDLCQRKRLCICQALCASQA